MTSESRGVEAAERPPPSGREPAAAKTERAPRAATGWAGVALMAAGAVGALAKLGGVLLVPGMRGVVTNHTMELAELASSTFAYLFAGLLVALVSAASFELARRATRGAANRELGIVARGSAIALSGLVVALSAPAVVTRLPALGAIALSVVTSAVVMVAAVAAAKKPHTRALAAVLGGLALASLLGSISWILTATAGTRASVAMYETGRVLTMGAIAAQVLAVLFAATWLATRSRLRGRVLSNAAVLGAMVITYLAARDTVGPPPTMQAVLHGSLVHVAGVTLPYGFGAVAAFLVPASILLAGVALAQRAPTVILAPLALALLSHGSFDVPLPALPATAAAEWAMLATRDDRSMWSALRSRSA